MSIELVDQHIVDEVNSLLKGILANPYIIKQEILSQLPDKIVDNFINTYGIGKGNHGVEIPLYFAFPQTPPKTAFLLAQFKGSQEDEDNAVLGNYQGNLVSNDNGNLTHEKLPVVVDGKQAYLQPSKPIKSVYSIPQTNVYEVRDNKVYIPYLPIYNKDSKFDLFYIIKEENTGQSYPIGINTIEAVTIDFISNNTNTIRCLSGIFVYIETYLRKSLEDNGAVFLPSVELNGMDMVQDVSTAENSLGGQQLYYRRLTVNYHVTQTIKQNMNQTLDKIILGGE
jgi:hypothetical protein